MNSGSLPDMNEALRLTREGRLLEATALLQGRNVGGTSSDTSPTIDVESWTTVREPETKEKKPETSTEATGTSPLRTASKETRRTRPGSWLRQRTGGTPPSGFTTGFEVGTPVGTPSSGAETGGEYTERIFSNAAGRRRYGLYVPESYAGQRVPVVVMLHGCTQGARDFAAGTKMNRLAEEHGFLVVYPEQGSDSNATKCWNWFRGEDQARDRGEPSIICGITREVASEYEVVEGGIFIAGLSAGGAMAAVMASLYPEVYSAVGVHSGLAPGLASDMMSAFSAMNGTTMTGWSKGGVAKPGATVPAIIFQGDRDGTVHPKNAGHLLDHFGGRELRSSVEGQSPGGLSYTRKVFGAANGGSSASSESWTVHGLGHAWSGGDGRGSYTDGRGPDASAEMARFFMQTLKTD